MATLPFIQFVEEGTNYEIGRARGRYIGANPEWKAFFSHPPEGRAALDGAEAARRVARLERACPGLRDELTGFAEGLGAAVDSLVLLHGAVAQKRPRACGIVAVPGSHTADGHSYMARSYEYNLDDELCLSVTRVPGKYAHVGFSLMQVGRFDGMNEKGLCAAIASCENVRSSAGLAEGVHFSIAVRRVLDDCATVAEALERMRTLPLADNCAYVFADSSGDTGKVETLCLETGVSRAQRRGGPQYAFNHYLTPEHRALAPEKKWFSAIREERAQELLAAREKVSRAALFGLLNAPVPEGLCSSAYNDYFGTLHAMFFDLTEKKLLVCFGSPERGEWFEADLWAEAGCAVTMVDCPDVAVPASYWQLC